MPSRPKTGGRVTQLHVTVTPADRATLEHWLRSSRCPYGVHKRARAVLLVADGLPIAEIARRVDMQRRHVYRWVRRFQQAGVHGLLDKPRHGPVLGRWAKQTREDNDVC
jgi:hypothetical protein